MDIPWIQVALTLFGISVSVLQAIEEYKKRRGYFYIWLILICGLTLFGILDVLDRQETETATTREIIDSSKISASENARLVRKAIDSTRELLIDSLRTATSDLRDSLSAEINESRVLPVEKRPLVDLSSKFSKTNPALKYNTTLDTITYEIGLENFGNDEATDIKDQTYIITYLGTGPRIDNLSPLPTTNPSTILPQKEIAIVRFQVHRNKGIKVKPMGSRVYIYFKVTYKNSLGVEMKPLRKVFFVKDDLTGEPLADEYNEIIHLVKSHGVFTP